MLIKKSEKRQEGYALVCDPENVNVYDHDDVTLLMGDKATLCQEMINLFL